MQVAMIEAEEINNSRLDGILGNLMQWEVALPMEGVGMSWSFRSLPFRDIRNTGNFLGSIFLITKKKKDISLEVSEAPSLI